MKLLSLGKPLQIVSGTPDKKQTIRIETKILNGGITQIQNYFQTVKDNFLKEISKESSFYLEFICDKNTTDEDYKMLFDIIAAMIPPMFLTTEAKTDENVIVKEEIVAETSIDTVTINKFARFYSCVAAFNAGLRKEDEDFTTRVVG